MDGQAKLETDERGQPKRRAIAPLLVAAFFVLLPIAYVASAGPATWAYNRGYIPFTVLLIYEPLHVICLAVPAIGDFMEGYTETTRHIWLSVTLPGVGLGAIVIYLAARCSRELTRAN
jgi:hypothetical protein